MSKVTDMNELSWDERNKLRNTYMAVWTDMVSDQLPRQFFGVDAECFKLDNDVFKAVENEDDGYRSSMDYVEPCSPEGKIFFKSPVDTVKIVEAPEKLDDRDYYKFEGWQLVSTADGHVWLTIGTDNAHDYYPCFTFRYTPRAS